MNAKDLMIGDWIHRCYTCSDTGREVVIDFQLAEIRNLAKSLYVCSEKGVVCKVENAEPIPLTAEILEKNGWELISNTPYKLEYFWSTGAIEEYADIRIYVGKDHNDVWRWDFPILNIHLYRGDIELTKLRYIHELQHALRLCGIDKDLII